MKTVCSGCGAILPDGATRCDLCGTPVSDEPAVADAPAVPAEAPMIAGPVLSGGSVPPGVPAPPEGMGAPGETLAQGVFCPACGHRNPPGARFCNECGTELPELKGRRLATPVATGDTPAVADTPELPTDAASAAVPAAPTEAPAPPVERRRERAPEGANDPGKRAFMLAGIASLIVLVVFVVALAMRDTPTDAAPVTPDGPAAVLGGQAALPTAPGGQIPAAEATPIEVDPATVDALPLPDSLRAAAAAASGVMRGAQGAATAAAWADAGLLYLRLTLRAPAEQRGPIARQAIAAFQQSLALEESADVRTHMAEAYQYDTENPMQAIVLLREVLASNPDHPEANLRLGLMRVQIGRTEDAAESFRRVLARTQPGDPLYQQAAAQLQALGRAPIPG